MYLSVIIPAYNEEKRLSKTLVGTDQYLRAQTYNYEIIVVSDGSKDKTAEIVRNLQGQIKGLEIIDNKENHGKGYVVRQGLLEAKGKYRLFMDADNSTPISEVKKMFPYFEQGYDIVIGSRDEKGAKILNPQPWFRIVMGSIFKLMVQLIVGLWGIGDTQCGFKALSDKAVKDILPKCGIDRWAFDPEILAVGKTLGYRIKVIPISWFNDEQSKVKLSATFKMAMDLFKIRWNLVTGSYSNDQK